MNNLKLIEEGFLKAAKEHGFPEAFAQGMLRETALYNSEPSLNPSSLLDKEAEALFLNDLNEELQKMGSDVVLTSVEQFKKLATEESESFRAALRQEMEQSMGADFTLGVLKQAEEEMEKLAAPTALLNMLPKAFQGFKSMTSGFKAAPAISSAVNRGATRFSLGGAMNKPTMPGFVQDMGAGLQQWGQRAALGQSAKLSNKAYIADANQLSRTSRRENMAGGLRDTTRDELKKYTKPTLSQEETYGGGVSDRTKMIVSDKLDPRLSQMSTARIPMRRSLWAPSLSRAASWGGKGALAGGSVGMLGGIPGALGGAALGGLGGAALGGLGGAGVLGAGALGAGALGYGAYKGLQGLSGGGQPGPQGKPQMDQTGMPANRNQLLPGIGNDWAGAGGGALMGMLMARQMGLEGPMAWLLPLLGGYGGYKFLPQMINKYKDPIGYGENRLPAAASNQYANMFNNING